MFSGRTCRLIGQSGPELVEESAVHQAVEALDPRGDLHRGRGAIELRPHRSLLEEQEQRGAQALARRRHSLIRESPREFNEKPALHAVLGQGAQRGLSLHRDAPHVETLGFALAASKGGCEDLDGSTVFWHRGGEQRTLEMPFAAAGQQVAHQRPTKAGGGYGEHLRAILVGLYRRPGVAGVAPEILSGNARRL